MRIYLRLTATFVLCLAFLVAKANADSISYTLTTTSGNIAQFSIPDNSKPSAFAPGIVANFYDVAGTFNGDSVVFSCIGFYDGPNPFKQDGIIATIGSPWTPYTMFFGSGNNPMYSGDANSVQLSTLSNESVSAQYVFTPWSNYVNYLASTKVPEPSPLLMLGLGVVALVGFRRKLTA